MNDKYFQQDAKQIVDMVFDAKVLRPDLTRDNLNSMEEFISYLLQSKFESYQKLENLMAKIEKTK